MRRFDAVNYAELPTPDAIETWGFDPIKDAMVQDFLARWAILQGKYPTLPTYDVEQLESDPGIVQIEVGAFREGLIRQRINEAVRATYLASALKNDLTDRAAEYLTARADGEIDESLRSRGQLAWENLSIGGSYGGYAYQARSVAPVDLADVAVWGYEVHETALFGDKTIADFPKGEVRIALLGAAASGLVPSSLIDRVQTTLAARDRRKVNDRINVVQATVCPYTVDARLHLKRGSTPGPILEAANLRARAYAAATRLIGIEATRGGYQAALMNAAPGLIVDLDLYSPAAAVGGGPCEAPVASGFHIDWIFA